MTLESFPDPVFFPPGISTSTQLQPSWLEWPAGVGLASARQWPLGFPESALKNTGAALFPLRCLEVLGQSERLWVFQLCEEL